jgi:hypothetical protein
VEDVLTVEGAHLLLGHPVEQVGDHGALVEVGHD